MPLAGLAVGMTCLYLGMRAVMQIGGACADGGPFVPRQPCPQGVPAMMIGGIWGGIACIAVYLWQAMKHGVPHLVFFAWPALFISLGWNFLEFGIDPPGDFGLVWGWLICAVLFFIMGTAPLFFVLRPAARRFTGADSPNLPAAGSGRYWLVLQLAAIAAGISLGGMLFTAVTT